MFNRRGIAHALQQRRLHDPPVSTPSDLESAPETIFETETVSEFARPRRMSGLSNTRARSSEHDSHGMAILAMPSRPSVYLTHGDDSAHGGPLALPLDGRNPVLPPVDGKSMSVPRYCNRVTRAGALTRRRPCGTTVSGRHDSRRNFSLAFLL